MSTKVSIKLSPKLAKLAQENEEFRKDLHCAMFAGFDATQYCINKWILRLENLSK
jgi:flagellar biosynthesis chaperone FliJ